MSQPRILVLLVCKMQEVGIHVGTVNGIHVHTSYIIHSYMEIYRCVGDLTHFITGQKKEVKRKACTSLADTCSGDTDTEHLIII